MSMRTESEMIKFYEDLYKNNMLWFIIGALIGADAFIMYDGEERIKALESGIETLRNMVEFIPKTNIPQSTKELVVKSAEDGIAILTRDHDLYLEDYVKRSIIEDGKHEYYDRDR